MMFDKSKHWCPEPPDPLTRVAAEKELTQGAMEKLHDLWIQSSTSTASSVVVLASTLLLVWMILGYVFLQRRHKLPPGPRPWPIVGNFPSMVGDTPHRPLQKLAIKYGGLMYLRFGSVPCIVISTAEVGREFFQTHDENFSSRPRKLVWRVLHNYDDNFKVMGSAPYGPYWRNVRRFFREEMFSPKCLAAREGIRMQEIQRMTAILLDDAQRRGSIVNLKHWLWGVTSNTITRIFCNRRFYGPDQSQQEREEFEQMTSGILSALGSFVISDYIDPSLWFITRLQGWEKKFESVRALSTRVSEKIFEVEKHRERRESDESYVPDFVDAFLTKPLEGDKLCPDEDIILFLKHMLNAGTDTSATLVEWTMAELMRRPETMKRAQEELDSVVGRREFVQESDFAQLPFLQAVVKEGFRLHPPSPLSILRESLHACEFRGYKFPAKTLLIINIFAIHRDPAVYENPDEFRPERFLERPEINHLAKFNSFELVPFGIGRRMCPGSTLGNVMVMLMLANLLFRFRWSMPEGLRADDMDMSDAGGLTVWMKTPLCLVASPRSPQTVGIKPDTVSH